MGNISLFIKLNNFLLSNSRLFFWASFILVMIALFAPSYGARGEVFNADLLIHYIMFLVFVGSSFLYLNSNKGISTISILILLLLFIPASEFVQENFVPGRGYELSDVLAGYAGVFTGYIIYKRYENLRLSEAKLQGK